MGTRRSTEPGPATRRVRANLRELRAQRGISLRDLSQRLEQLGHPVLPSGLSKLETGDRRADVDDLIAIAVALDISPNRLLLPETADDETIELTPQSEASARSAWRWATGDAPLPPDHDIDRAARFRDENRPHDPGDSTPLSEVEKHEDILWTAARACRDAVEQSGLPRETVMSYVSLALKMSLAVRTGREGA